MKNYFTLSMFLFLFLTFKAIAQPSYPVDPSKAKILSPDVINFIEAFKTLSPDKDSLLILKELYFDKASPGMTEFMTKHELSPESLLKGIQMHPEQYSGIEKFLKQLPGFEADYVKELEAYKSVMPDAMFPPVYLLVGNYSGVAQASKLGQLVTIERGIEDPDKLLTLMVHELTHFQQAMSMGLQNYAGVYAKKDNMLDLILREGCAEFITYKLVRKNEDTFTRLKKYEENETELWERFNTDLKDQNSNYWLSYSLDEEDKSHGILLGYAVGYKIVEAYYDQAEDKSQALNEILNIQDASAFIEKSNYKPFQ